jgi:hypothetical protein
MLTIKVKEYREVGAFYLALWEHLDALSGRSRWLQASDVPSFEQRKMNLQLEYERLSELRLTPEVLRSISGEFNYKSKALQKRSVSPKFSAKLVVNTRRLFFSVMIFCIVESLISRFVTKSKIGNRLSRPSDWSVRVFRLRNSHPTQEGILQGLSGVLSFALRKTTWSKS